MGESLGRCMELLCGSRGGDKSTCAQRSVNDKCFWTVQAKESMVVCVLDTVKCNFVGE